MLVKYVLVADYHYILFACFNREQILDAFERQRDTFEMAIGMDKSIALKDLLIIAIYCHLPPSRGMYRQLCVDFLSAA